jgi:hypothetical protein
MVTWRASRIGLRCARGPDVCGLWTHTAHLPNFDCQYGANQYRVLLRHGYAHRTPFQGGTRCVYVQRRGSCLFLKPASEQTNGRLILVVTKPHRTHTHTHTPLGVSRLQVNHMRHACTTTATSPPHTRQDLHETRTRAESGNRSNRVPSNGDPTWYQAPASVPPIPPTSRRQRDEVNHVRAFLRATPALCPTSQRQVAPRDRRTEIHYIRCASGATN